MEDFLCNTNVYGHLNILFVTGVVRLDPAAVAVSTSVSWTKQKFDAWPSSRQKKNTRDKCNQHWEDLFGIRSPFGDY